MIKRWARNFNNNWKKGRKIKDVELLKIIWEKTKDVSLQEDDCKERDISQLKLNLIKIYKIRVQRRYYKKNLEPLMKLKKKLTDMVKSCDTNQARLCSDFGVKVSTVQFYVIEHNFKSNRWIELKLYQKIPKVFVYVGVHFQENPHSERTCNIGPNRLYEFCYLLPFDLWTSYLVDHFPTRMWEFILGIF